MFRLKSYKRYNPSPNSNSTGDQTTLPKPLIEAMENRPVIFKFDPFKSGQSKELDTFDLQDSSEIVMWAIGRSKRFEHMLEEPHLSSHDVYVVCRARGSTISIPTSHWSVYSQGHFYHLSLENRNPDAPPPARGVVMDSTAVILKDEDHTSSGYEDDVTPGFPLPPLLTAFHVGQTDYTTPELRDMAGQIIDDISSYNIAFRNCHHFVTTFIMNILMRNRNNILSIGTAKQIASWDLRGKYTGVHSNTVKRGFLTLFPKRTSLHTDISFEANTRRILLGTSKLTDRLISLADPFALDAFIGSLKLRYEEGPSGWKNIDPTITSPYEDIMRRLKGPR